MFDSSISVKKRLHGSGVQRERVEQVDLLEHTFFGMDCIDHLLKHQADRSWAIPVNVKESGNAQIKEFLNVNSTLHALVTDHGNLYYVRQPDLAPRIIRLKYLVEKNIGVCYEYPVTEAAYTNYRGELDRKKKIHEHDPTEVNRLAQFILDEAIIEEASDIYIDAHRDTDRTLVRFRVHGEAQLRDVFPFEEGMAVLRGLWSLDPTSHFTEADASDCSFHFKEQQVRGSILPDIRGVSGVFRLRHPGRLIPLDQCGYSELQLEHIAAICESPGGMAIISGEPNSGKSTTLSTIMANLPKVQKIIEVSDPIEVPVEHATQVAITRYGERAEEKLQNILSTTVRQNPDTLFLGEIRDQRSAEVAMNMAIQGKRVYSTLHTQSALTVYSRLVTLGIREDLLIEPNVLVGLVNQNLVPLTCPDCSHIECPYDGQKGERYRRLFGESDVRYRDNTGGCRNCLYGIVGQTLVSEVYPICLAGQEFFTRIQRHDMFAVEDYMRETFKVQTKSEHAVTKVKQGLIDPWETEKRVGRFFLDA